MAAQQEMDLQAYYDALDRHDWYYGYSDDHRVWQAGNRRNDELTTAATASPEHQSLLTRFQAHVFSGEPWGNSKQPKPDRP